MARRMTIECKPVFSLMLTARPYPFTSSRQKVKTMTEPGIVAPLMITGPHGAYLRISGGGKPVPDCRAQPSRAEETP
jgi:hypothetical protein